LFDKSKTGGSSKDELGDDSDSDDGTFSQQKDNSDNFI
jgi:hypothetical protein